MRLKQGICCKNLINFSHICRISPSLIPAQQNENQEEKQMEYRVEHDSMGEVNVPADRYWGAQTQRSFENFKSSSTKSGKCIFQSIGRGCRLY